MKRFILTTALALGVAAPALASDQLASKAGVEPGVYTNSELAQLISARRDQDWTTVRAIENGASGAGVSDNRTTPGHVQLAKSLNVDPAAFSATELAQLKAARVDNDQTRTRFIEKNASVNSDVTATFSSRSASQSPGHVQLAKHLDVDPADFTTNELVQLRSAKEDGDWSRVRFILSQAG